MAGEVIRPGGNDLFTMYYSGWVELGGGYLDLPRGSPPCEALRTRLGGVYTHCFWFFSRPLSFYSCLRLQGLGLVLISLYLDLVVCWILVFMCLTWPCLSAAIHSCNALHSLHRFTRLQWGLFALMRQTRFRACACEACREAIPSYLNDPNMEELKILCHICTLPL